MTRLAWVLVALILFAASYGGHSWYNKRQDRQKKAAAMEKAEKRLEKLRTERKRSCEDGIRDLEMLMSRQRFHNPRLAETETMILAKIIGPDLLGEDLFARHPRIPANIRARTTMINGKKVKIAIVPASGARYVALSHAEGEHYYYVLLRKEGGAKEVMRRETDDRSLPGFPATVVFSENDFLQGASYVAGLSPRGSPVGPSDPLTLENETGGAVTTPGGNIPAGPSGTPGDNIYVKPGSVDTPGAYEGGMDFDASMPPIDAGTDNQTSAWTLILGLVWGAFWIVFYLWPLCWVEE